MYEKLWNIKSCSKIFNFEFYFGIKLMEMILKFDSKIDFIFTSIFLQVNNDFMISIFSSSTARHNAVLL